MAWFGGKSRHRKQVEATYKNVVYLHQITTIGGADAPLVLRLNQPESRLRYLVFCLSTAHAACAHSMENQNEVLNEVGQTLMQAIFTHFKQKFLGDDVDLTSVGNRVFDYGQDYLARWDAYIDLAESGNITAPTDFVCGMLQSAESTSPCTDADVERLRPLAVWIQLHMVAMRSAFANMAR